MPFLFFLPGVGQGLLLPLPLVHLMAVGVGVTALLGVSRHLALALLAFLLAPAPVAGLGRLFLGLCLVAGALALIRGFYVGLRWAPQSSPAHSASRLR